MEKKETSVHPYSSVNLKREDVKAILYDAIDLPWGYSHTHSAHKINIPYHKRWEGAGMLMSLREETRRQRRK